jgi:hypothetical protein
MIRRYRGLRRSRLFPDVLLTGRQQFDLNQREGRIEVRSSARACIEIATPDRSSGSVLIQEKLKRRAK